MDAPLFKEFLRLVKQTGSPKKVSWIKFPFQKGLLLKEQILFRTIQKRTKKEKLRLLKVYPIIISNSDTKVCPPVRGEKPRALASGLYSVQSDKTWYK